MTIKGDRARYRTSTQVLFVLGALALINLVRDATTVARGDYVTFIPNYSVHQCNACHGDPFNGGNQEAVFKAAFAGTTPTDHTYTTAFANTDHDGDGFTTGEE